MTREQLYQRWQAANDLELEILRDLREAQGAGRRAQALLAASRVATNLSRKCWREMIEAGRAEAHDEPSEAEEEAMAADQHQRDLYYGGRG